MPLQVWLPLLTDTENKGISGITTQGNPYSWVDGKLGKTAHFEGNASNVIYNNTTEFNYTDNFSFALWLKHSYNSEVAAQYAFTVGRADMGGYGYGCQVVGASQLYVRFGNQTISISNVPSGEWHHIAVAIKDSKMTAYRDGTLVSTATVGTLPTYSDGNGMGVGCFHYTGNIYPYFGDLCDFRIYDHCLSPKEVKLLSQGLVAHYQLNDGYLEPTTNMTNVRYVGADSGSGWGGHTSVTTVINCQDAPIPYDACSKIAVTYSGSGGGGVGRFIQRIDVSPNTTYTYSGYIKTSNNFGGSNLANMLYRYEYNSSGTNIYETGVFDMSRRISLGDGWYRCWGTFTTKDTTVAIAIYFFVYPYANVDYYVGCWQLEQKDHLTPYVFGTRSETIVYDSSGFNHHGKAIDSLTISSDSARNLISTYFDGTSSGVLIENLPLSPVINSDITYSFWIKPDGENGARSVYFGSYSANSWSIEKTTSNILRLYWMGNPDEYCSEATISDGVWQHICITKQGSNDVKVYINGELKWTSTAAHNTLSFPTTYRIGRDVRSGDNTPYKGFMSDFRIYATALSAEDIQALYNAPVSIANNGTMITQGEFVEV